MQYIINIFKKVIVKLNKWQDEELVPSVPLKANKNTNKRVEKTTPKVKKIKVHDYILPDVFLLSESINNFISIKELISDNKFKFSSNVLNIALGKKDRNENVFVDLKEIHSLFIGGATGSGKTNLLHSIILSILYGKKPDECRLVLIDPKMVELSAYNEIPHLLTPVITDPCKAIFGLKWIVKEIENRYGYLARLNVRNIKEYNKKIDDMKNIGAVIKRTIQTGFDMDTGAPIFEEQELDLTPLPHIVVIVDGITDLILVSDNETLNSLERITRMGYIVGVHIIVSISNFSKNNKVKAIKSLFNNCLCFQVFSKKDSMFILERYGAEKLTNKGHMLCKFMNYSFDLVKGCFVKYEDIEKVASFWKEQGVSDYTDVFVEEQKVESYFDSDISDEKLYASAVEIVKNNKKASTSYLQRKLRIEYNKAASIVDRMEAEGIVSEADHVGRRKVL